MLPRPGASCSEHRNNNNLTTTICRCSLGNRASVPDFPDIRIALCREKPVTKRETSPENRLRRRFGHVRRTHRIEPNLSRPGDRLFLCNRLGNVPANDEKEDPQRHEQASRYEGLLRFVVVVICEGLMSPEHQRDYHDRRTRKTHSSNFVSPERLPENARAPKNKNRQHDAVQPSPRRSNSIVVVDHFFVLFPLGGQEESHHPLNILRTSANILRVRMDTTTDTTALYPQIL